MPGTGRKHSASSPRARSLARFLLVALGALSLAPLVLVVAVRAQSGAQDPGVRGGPIGAGGFIVGLTTNQKSLEGTTEATFEEINGVTAQQTGNLGLGPGYDSNQCSACHAFPAAAGSAAFTNQDYSVFDTYGALNVVPFFEAYNGPVQNARFPGQLGNPALPDNGVHQIFTITGRADAGSCDMEQPNFSEAQSENNLGFRIPLPIFGDGLLEIIPESQITANQAAQCAQYATTGICGTPQIGPDGGFSRFGWKAQDRSLLIFSAEAYNVEEGVSNEAFPNEIDDSNPACVINAVPEDHSNFTNLPPHRFPGDPERQALFSRFLAPPVPGACPGGVPSSCTNGQNQFNTIGCNTCHSSPSPTQFVTPASAIAALGNQKVNVFSDVLLHHMGSCLADNIVQGAAAGDMFKSIPLWGVGQRIFFLHDGRTSDIVQAIEDHSDSFCTGGSGGSGYPASEADSVINAYNALSTSNQQDLVNFLRSL